MASPYGSGIGLGRYKGIVFDLDGTLVNSEVDFVKMKNNMIKVIEEHGAPRGVLTPKMTTVVVLEHAEKYWEEQGKPEKERQELRDEMTRLMDQGELEAVDTLTAITGAKDAVHRLKKMGYRLAILTRSHHEYAVKALEKTGMIGDFELILGRGETPQPKPYAEAMIHAAKLMKLKLGELFLVGDHHIDSTCAVNAGCHFIGVATGPRPDRSWEVNKPENILPSVADLPAYLDETDR
ncbi:MAG: HAD hydrolase-like protein [Candidatus Bathyarchaeota archaeon]|nr:HAD hydrolase-like protein [Candidatus Bathyarchaeota archaeon]